MAEKCSTNLSEADFVLELYKVYREKVTHEDNLVHQRMVWFVTLQALLFTSFAILLGESSTSDQAMWKLTLDQMRKLALIFSTVGIVSALAAAASVWAAFSAIDKAFCDWTDMVSNWADERKALVAQLPSIVGAGKLSGTHTLGKYAGRFFPVLVAIAWYAIIREIYGSSIFHF